MQIIDEAFAAVVEDINGNADGDAATAEQINLIAGISGAVRGTDYSEARICWYLDVQPASPTTSEIQTVVNALNARNRLCTRRYSWKC